MQAVLERGQLREVAPLQFSQSLFKLEHGCLNLDCCTLNPSQLFCHPNEKWVVGVDDINEVNPDRLDMLLKSLENQRQRDLRSSS